MAPVNQLKSGEIQYVFATAEAAEIDDTIRLIGDLADAAREAKWMVLTILGNVVVMARGLDVMDGWNARSCDDLIALLHQRTRRTARVVFGAERLWYGNLGSDSRMSYGVLFPHTPEIMTALANVPPGEAQKFDRQ